MLSAWLRVSTSSLRSLSSFANCSASRTAFLISSSLRFVEAVIVTFCSLPVPRSFAETCTMPFASMSKLTSICGTPRGAGAMPASWKRPSVLLYCAISRSPWRTCTSTLVWPSAAVEKIWLFFVGMVVLRSIKRVNTPPTVSMPRESGVTSSRRMSFTSPPSTPPWMAAPIATHSSGLMPLNVSLPVTVLTISCTAGIRVEPPTRMTLSMSAFERPASFMAMCMQSLVLSTRSRVSSLNFARVMVMSRCFGPLLSAVMNGRFTLVCAMLESSIFAFSAASFRRWSAMRSEERSMPLSLLNCLMM